MDDLVYSIWLSLALTPGKDSFKKLSEFFSCAEDIYHADEDEIAKCIGTRSDDFNALLNKSIENAERILSYCQKKNIGLLSYYDKEFPNSLREIDNPPVLLYYRGVLPDFNSQCFVSVVGTRRLTDYGRRNAFYIGRDLAKCGIKVVSGLAVGIDGVATAGALSTGSSTVAFLGSGINVCYPEGHITLAREIVKNGCVLTEYPPDTKPDGRNFPVRNRLISGVSCASIIIEGGVRSGSMITARNAKKQGRAVYALPGNVDNKTSEVSNILIKNGAKLITSAYDVIKDFEFVYTGKINPFNLDDKFEVRMHDVLSQYKVQCVTHSDKEFRVSGVKKRSEPAVKSIIEEESELESPQQKPAERTEKSFTEAGFDKTAFKIYMKIPTEGSVPYSSLCDETNDMRTVMRALFQLDLGNFIEMLPGERVKRK